MTIQGRSSTGRREPPADVLEHLKVLSQKMSEVSAEANSFAGRFLFGGIVAVLALLNTDLLLEKRLVVNQRNALLAPALLALVLVLSGVYFYIVSERLRFFRRAYRSTKHKYEVTLYALLLDAPERDYLVHLEVPLKDAAANAAEFRRDATFPEAMAYLHSHHKRSYDRLVWARDWWLAMAIVTLAVVVKVGLIALSYPDTPAGTGP